MKKLFLAFSILLLLCVFYVVDFDGFVAALVGFPLVTVLGVFLLFLLNFFVVTVRYWRVLRQFGYGASFFDVVRANVSGSIASLLMIPLLGQVAGRQVMLERAGVSAVENAAIAFYERFVVGTLSGVFALIGGLFIFSSDALYYVRNIPIFEVSLIFIASVFSYLYIVAGRREALVVKRLFGWRSLLNLIEVYMFTFLANAFVLASFFLVFSVVLPDASALSILSLAAIVSFLAGLPVSFGGWGLRELSSVSLVSLLGGATASGLAASVLLGVISIAAVLILVPVLLIARKPQEAESYCEYSQFSTFTMGLEEIAVWVLTLMVGGLVFFQIHVQIGEGYLNVNLADPFAMLIFSVAMLNLLLKRELPAWRVPRFNLYLLLMTLAFGVAYLHGYFSFGSSAWASGKLIGWLVLLGYLFCGYMVVRYFRMSGFFSLSKLMLMSLGLILVVSMVKWFLLTNDFVSFEGVGYILEAYSGNRNALAFQVLMVLALSLAFDAWYVKRPLRVAGIDVLFFVVALMVAAILLTASRSAILTLVVIFICAFYLGVGRRKFLLVSFLSGGLIFFIAQYGVYLFSFFYSYVLSDVASQASAASLPISTESSDSLRLNLLIAALDMWLKYPLFGAGLGAFYHESAEVIGVDVVIHNTALWMLAEFGLFGFVLFACSFFCVCRYAVTGCGLRVARNAIILLLLAFAVMSLFHEVFYQRIFWIFIGACIAVPRTSVRPV